MDNNPHRCPYCNKGLLLLSSLSLKICIECNKEFEWHLNYKQLPLIKHQR